MFLNSIRLTFSRQPRNTRMPSCTNWGTRRLVISGQVGLRLDGTVPSDFVSQMDLAWDNLLEIVEAADMSVENLLKISMFAVPPNSITMVRAMRDELKGHICASTYLQVAGLANPAFLFEVEAEAIGRTMTEPAIHLAIKGMTCGAAPMR